MYTLIIISLTIHLSAYRNLVDQHDTFIMPTVNKETPQRTNAMANNVG